MDMVYFLSYRVPPKELSKANVLEAKYYVDDSKSLRFKGSPHQNQTKDDCQI
jgi:hypothetical protein